MGKKGKKNKRCKNFFDSLLGIPYDKYNKHNKNNINNNHNTKYNFRSSNSVNSSKVCTIIDNTSDSSESEVFYEEFNDMVNESVIIIDSIKSNRSVQFISFINEEYEFNDDYDDNNSDHFLVITKDFTKEFANVSIS
jgi:hypothetical protein